MDCVLKPYSTPPEGAPPWPALRDDLELLRGPVFAGVPTWTLYDPARHRYIRLGWMEMEVLQRWQLADATAIAADIAASTPLRPTAQDVASMLTFAHHAELTTANLPSDSMRLATRAKPSGPLKWLLHHYLFFRIRLCNPDRFLGRCVPALSWIFTRRFCQFLVALVVCAAVLIAQQWATFSQEFARLLTPEGALGVACALAVSKLVHEFGHGLAARFYGCRVPAMGVAFLVLWPVLWTDTTDAWRLRRARERLAIDCAGMVAEITLAACASILWSILPDGSLRDGVFTLSSSTWILTLSVNLSPLMRFDGYYILSDLLGIPNLQERAFAWTRWRARQFLFGNNSAPPEPFSRARGRMLLAYSLASWTYRFFLFTGIALVVYHAVFRALGLMLMGIELWVFLARPILSEGREWFRQMCSNHTNWRARTTAVVVGLVVLLMAVPWGGRLHAPALLRATEQAEIYTNGAGTATRVPHEGMPFNKGQIILALRSADLEHDTAVASARLASLNASLSGRVFDPTQSVALNDTIDQIARQAAEQARVRTAISFLQIPAPFTGTLVDVPPDLHAGDTLHHHEKIGTLISNDGAVIEAYIGEQDMDRFKIGASATFYPTSTFLPSVQAHVTAISAASLPELDSPELASAYGGHVQVHKTQDTHLQPDHATYRVSLRPDVVSPGLAQRTTGVVCIQSSPLSTLLRIYRKTIALFMGEAGF
ncbi:MAG: site-2 protease family protein [Acetobacter sp.]